MSLDFFKDYIELDGEKFKLESIEKSNGDRIVIDNLNGMNVPVIQWLGIEETTIRVTFMYGGYNRIVTNTSNQGTTTTSSQNGGWKNAVFRTPNRVITSNNVEVSGDLFSEEKTYFYYKNFVDNLILSKKIIGLKFPDGDVVFVTVNRANQNFQARNLVKVSLDLTLVPTVEKVVTKTGSKAKLKTFKEVINSKLTKSFTPENWLSKVYKNAANWIGNSTVGKFTKGISEYVKKGIQKHKEAKDMVTSTMRVVQNTMNNINSSINQINSLVNSPIEVMRTLQGVQNSMINVCRSAGNVMKTIQNIANTFKSFSNSSKDNFTLMTTLFGGMSGDSTQDPIPPGPTSNTYRNKTANTAKAVFANQANSDMNTMRVAVFTEAADAATSADFENAEEVATAIDTLDAMFQEVINNEDLSQDIRDVLVLFKIELDAIMEERERDSRQIITIDIPSPQSLQQIVYNYYGNLDNYDDIVLLNSDLINEIVFVSGKIKLYEV